MEIIYYSTKVGAVKDPLLYAITERLSGVHIEAYAKPEHLRAKLEMLRTYSNRIVILVAPSEEVLIDIYSMHHLLHTVSSILILPDSEAHTVALGQRMKANFLFFMDSQKDDILSVVEQLVENARTVIAINGWRNSMTGGDLSHGSFRGQDKVSNL